MRAVSQLGIVEFQRIGGMHGQTRIRIAVDKSPGQVTIDFDHVDRDEGEFTLRSFLLPFWLRFTVVAGLILPIVAIGLLAMWGVMHLDYRDLQKPAVFYGIYGGVVALLASAAIVIAATLHGIRMSHGIWVQNLAVAVKLLLILGLLGFGVTMKFR